MSMIVGADVGRNATKIYSKNGKNVYEASFKSYASEDQNVFEKASRLILDGKQYLVGSSGVGDTILKDNKTLDETFKVCLIKGITDIETDENEFDIVIGFPIKDFERYKNDSIKELKGKSFKVTDSRDRDRVITINRVLVVPEAVQYTIEESSRQEGDFIVVDIGGNTVDTILYTDGRISTVKSYLKGVNNFYNHIADILTSKYDIQYTASLVEYAFKRGYYVVSGKRVSLNEEINLEREKVKWLESIILDVRKHFDWDAIESKCIGGGSLLFKNILDKVDIDVDENSIFANAKAFYEYGVEEYGQH